MGEDDKIKPDDGYFQRLPAEMPQHKVTISQPFLMGSTEVTVCPVSQVRRGEQVRDRSREGRLWQVRTRPKKRTRQELEIARLCR